MIGKEVFMPTSTYRQIMTVLGFLQQLMPKSILDIGLGNGKMGFLARDFLDVMLGGRYRREEWQVKIDGIEVFADYIQDHQRAIYDEIFVGDALEVIDGLGNYDVVIVGDVLEHFERGRAMQFLDKAFAHSRYVILSIPLGEKWTQDAIYGNEYERHLSFWNPEDFNDISVEKELVEFPDIGLYGSFLIDRNDYLHGRARQEAIALSDDSRHVDACKLLVEKTGSLPFNFRTELLFVELLVRQTQVAQALVRLEKLKAQFPEAASIQGVIDQLRQYQG
jgi:hypothetical protein